MSQVLRLSLPMTLWLVGFSALYGLQGLSCSRHWPTSVEPRTALMAASALYLMVQGLALLVILRRPDASRFVQRVAVGLAAVALGAAAWTSMPILAVSICR
jgi:hypothetical protein